MIRHCVGATIGREYGVCNVVTVVSSESSESATCGSHFCLPCELQNEVGFFFVGERGVRASIEDAETAEEAATERGGTIKAAIRGCEVGL